MLNTILKEYTMSSTKYVDYIQTNWKTFFNEKLHKLER